jgi:hypothetical protein
MPFSEEIKNEVKRKSNFTCCYCINRNNKVDVHHIIPESEDGSNSIENAAPLCGSCHDLLGANPQLRKEIKGRRNHWYEICEKMNNPAWGWPIGLDVPELSHIVNIPPSSSLQTPGIQLTDKALGNEKDPPLLYLTIHVMKSRYFGDLDPNSKENWLYLEANMRFAMSLRILVQATNNRDVQRLMTFLTRGDEKYLPEFIAESSGEIRDKYIESMTGATTLHGPRPEDIPYGSGDYLLVWREANENRLLMSTFTLTNAGISVHARFTARVATKLASYLQSNGFVEN